MRAVCSDGFTIDCSYVKSQTAVTGDALSLRVMLRFSPAQFESRFVDHYVAVYFRYAQASLVLGLLLVLGDFFVDYLTHPEVRANLLRLALCVPVLGAGLAFALLLHVLGFIVQQPRVSMVALFSGAWILTGVVWGRETLKVTFFPFLIFAFCVPLGGTFAQGLTLPLRADAAKATAFITGTVLDIPVTRIGTKLIDPTGAYGSFDVAAECSGIRSLVALLAISIIFSVLTMRLVWKRAVMIGSAIPLALICNVMRVTTIIVAANAFKSQAAGQFVDSYFGYVTYGIAIGGVLLLGRLLREKPLPGPA